VDILILVAHVLKSYKSSTNSINLKLNYKGRSASHLSYLYLNRVFKQGLMKLYAFQNGVLMKNFGVPGPSSGMAGFQMRPPSYDRIKVACTVKGGEVMHLLSRAPRISQHHIILIFGGVINVNATW
jgi:hypothetical protein